MNILHREDKLRAIRVMLDSHFGMKISLVPVGFLDRWSPDLHCAKHNNLNEFSKYNFKTFSTKFEFDLNLI